MQTARALALDEQSPSRGLPPDAWALLDVPAGYGGRGSWLDDAAAPQLARLLARCSHEVVLSVGGATCEATPLLRDGAPGAPGVAPRDRFAAGLFGEAGEMNAFVEVVRAPERGTFCISALFVDPALRGCGVAGQIVEAVERWARAEGAGALHLHVPRRNAGALAFARRSGFARAGDAQAEKQSPSAAARLTMMSRRIA